MFLVVGRSQRESIACSVGRPWVHILQCTSWAPTTKNFWAPNVHRNCSTVYCFTCVSHLLSFKIFTGHRPVFSFWKYLTTWNVFHKYWVVSSSQMQVWIALFHFYTPTCPALVYSLEKVGDGCLNIVLNMACKQIKQLKIKPLHFSLECLLVLLNSHQNEFHSYVFCIEISAPGCFPEACICYQWGWLWLRHMLGGSR